MFQCTCLSKFLLMSFQFSLYAGCFTYKIVSVPLSVYGQCFTYEILCDFLSLWWVLLKKFSLSLCKVLTNFSLSLSLSLSVIRILPIQFFFSHFLPHFMMAVYFLNACVLSLYGRCFGYEIFRALSLFMVGIYSRNFVFFSPSMYDRFFTSRLCFSLCEW